MLEAHISEEIKNFDEVLYVYAMVVQKQHIQCICQIWSGPSLVMTMGVYLHTPDIIHIALQLGRLHSYKN